MARFCNILVEILPDPGPRPVTPGRDRGPASHHVPWTGEGPRPHAGPLTTVGRRTRPCRTGTRASCPVVDDRFAVDGPPRRTWSGAGITALARGQRHWSGQAITSRCPDTIAARSETGGGLRRSRAAGRPAGLRTSVCSVRRPAQWPGRRVGPVAATTPGGRPTHVATGSWLGTDLTRRHPRTVRRGRAGELRDRWCESCRTGVGNPWRRRRPGRR